MTPLYRRTVTPGGRVQYVEAGVYDHDVYPVGAHLVVVRPGLTSTRYNINPDHAALLAAAGDARDAMCRAILDAAQPRPNPDTEKQRRALEYYFAAGGERHTSLRSASVADIVEAGIGALVEAAKGAP